MVWNKWASSSLLGSASDSSTFDSDLSVTSQRSLTSGDPWSSIISVNWRVTGSCSTHILEDEPALLHVCVCVCVWFCKAPSSVRRWSSEQFSEVGHLSFLAVAKVLLSCRGRKFSRCSLNQLILETLPETVLWDADMWPTYLAVWGLVVRWGTTTTVLRFGFFSVVGLAARGGILWGWVYILQRCRATGAPIRRLAQSHGLRRSTTRGGGDNEWKSDKTSCDICQVDGTCCVNVEGLSDGNSAAVVVPSVAVGEHKGSTGLCDDAAQFHQFGLSVYSFRPSSLMSFILLLFSLPLAADISSLSQFSILTFLHSRANICPFYHLLWRNTLVPF